MRERIIIVLLTTLILLGVIGRYERKHAKMLRKHTELVQKNASMSLLNYKTRKKLAETEERIRQLLQKCSWMAKRCKQIIETKENCSYGAEFLERTL